MRKLRFASISAWAATALLLAGRIFRHPGGVRDALSGEFPSDAVLAYPAAYLVLAPFLHAADMLTFLSLKQHLAFLLFANAVWILVRVLRLARRALQAGDWARECGRWALFNLVYAGLFAAVTLLPRPMAFLSVSDPDVLVFDAHSHTSHSWDARKSFLPGRNLDWHRRAGFHAAFITDHNKFSGAQEARAAAAGSGISAWRGEELSLFQSHWALLGNRALVENGPYDTDLDGIRRFLGWVRESGGMAAVASLPEYWKYHRGRWEDLLRWGAHGFEVVNSAPIALDFPPSLRAEIAALCRKWDRPMLGASDAHGWGSAVYVWNLMRLPGWGAMPADAAESKAVQAIGSGGFGAVRVLVRVKADVPETPGGWAADPLRQLWEKARSLPPAHALSVLVWVWALWVLAAWRAKNG